MYKGYQDKLLRNHALDFDDLIMMTIQLFNRVPEVLNTTKINSNIFMSTNIKIQTKHNIRSY